MSNVGSHGARGGAAHRVDGRLFRGLAFGTFQRFLAGLPVGIRRDAIVRHRGLVVLRRDRSWR